MKTRLPGLLLVGCVCWLILSLRLPAPFGSFESQDFGRLPVMSGGRIKPMDTVARTSLLILHGKQALSLSKNTRSMGADEWLMEVMFDGAKADTRSTFRIDAPDVTGLLGFLGDHEKYFSYEQIKPHLSEIEKQARLAESVEATQRSRFQVAILKLFRQLDLYHRLKNSLRVDDDTDFQYEIAFFLQTLPSGAEAVRNRQQNKPFKQQDFDLIVEFVDRYNFLASSAKMLVLPPILQNQEINDWKSSGQGLIDIIRQGTPHPSLIPYAALADAYRHGDAEGFREAASVLREQFRKKFPTNLRRVDFEFRFNHFQPFYKVMVIYLLVFLLVLAAWLKNWPELYKGAFALLLLGFVLHTVGLLARMYLQGRPPVTNLYSSAIFVGWGSILLGLILEKIHRDGIGALSAATLGFLTLLIAHHLSGDGDTMEMLRAVLDTNYWLATHVVVITLGYASTFLAGFLAIVYVLRSLLARGLSEDTASTLERTVYAILCFATLFSFTGTVLGGVWADQSWGRFWGWDPKENGALIIVLWNALILHARWGGMIRQRGLMVMALFGNIVTSFSWFGVNMLGVGLHSYGFMDRAFFWLGIFITSQLLLMLLAFWKSFSKLSACRPPRDG